MYIDPGFGSMLFQSLVAVLVSTLVVLKIYWAKVISWFKKTK